METKQLNIYQKIQSVADEIATIGKDIKVGTGSNAYKAVSDQSVVTKVKKLERKYHLLSIPSVDQELVHQEAIKVVNQGYESIVYSFIVKMTTRFIDLDDPSITFEVISYGHGLDRGDKGLNKASTYARKYALLNAYKIATGEDGDATASEAMKLPKTASEKRVIVANFLNKDVLVLQNVLRRFNVGTLDDLTEKNVETIYNGFHQKGAL